MSVNLINGHSVLKHEAVAYTKTRELDVVRLLISPRDTYVVHVERREQNGGFCEAIVYEGDLESANAVYYRMLGKDQSQI